MRFLQLRFVLLTFVATLAVVLSFTQTAKADHVQDQKFPATIQVVAKQTPDLVYEPVFDRSENSSSLSDDQWSQLNKIASNQAQIWGDTILEGDYQADGQTVIDHVDAVKTHGTVVAYRMVYSERGWDTSTCTVQDQRDADALSECEEGRIQEASFISADLLSYLRDPKALASFQLNGSFVTSTLHSLH